MKKRRKLHIGSITRSVSRIELSSFQGQNHKAFFANKMILNRILLYNNHVPYIHIIKYANSHSYMMMYIISKLNINTVSSSSIFQEIIYEDHMCNLQSRQCILFCKKAT